ncbi:MAG: hypothetical protein PHQ44_06780, partial [Anaerovibrio sp.]|nr:hypothetical protein [Anaerovibrio sp.]
FLELYFRGKPNIKVESMVELSGMLKSYLKILQERNLMRISVKALAKQRVHEFVLKLVEKLAVG